MAPLLPAVAEPELRTTRPLTPPEPALAVKSDSAPLLVAVPEPVVMVTAPPVVPIEEGEMVPAESVIAPP